LGQSGSRTYHVVPVEAIPLDEWHESAGFSAIRLVKIDAEGSESFILQGMRHLLAKTRPLLIIEFNDQLLKEVGHSKEAFAQTLREHQYSIFAMNSAGLEEFFGIVSPEVLCMMDLQTRKQSYYLYVNCRENSDDDYEENGVRR
jgi:hypothetical protein